jgi:hypothetical protein
VRLAKVGAWIALTMSIALVIRVIAIDNPEALVIVAPAFVGALLALGWSRTRTVLLTALVLIGGTTTLSLIGWVGLLYVPSMILIGFAAVRTPRTRTLQAYHARRQTPPGPSVYG